METFYEYFVDEKLIKTIYLTLFHSLWQGALIAVIAGIIMLATKKASASWRYNLLLFSLFLFIGCAAATFVTQSGSAINYKQSITLSPNEDIGNSFIYSPSVQSNLKGFTNAIAGFCDDHANAIVIFWFLVICFKCTQLFIGLSGTSSLRKKMIFPAGPQWENRLKELSAQLGIKRYIRLAESGLAKVPLTVGYLKPVILIPLGLMAALPQDQIEAILLHELAHIRRKDYLVNIIQSLVEILFFFNPAIWWLSSLLRTERENCCDDLAIARINNRFNYVKALVAFEEYRGQIPQYASALTGSKNHLLNRAKRLISNHNKTLNPMEKIILTCGLAITGLLTVAFTQVEKHIIHEKTNSPVAAVKTPVSANHQSAFLQDTVKKENTRSRSSVTTYKDGKKYRVISVNDKLTELYIDDVRISDNKIADYKLITDNILAESRKNEEESRRLRTETMALRQQSRLLAEDSKRLAAESKEQLKQAEKTNPTQAEESKVLAKEEKKNAEEARLYAKEEKVNAKKQIEALDKQIAKLKVQKEKLEKSEKPFRPERSMDKVQKLNGLEYAPRELRLKEASPLKEPRLIEKARERVAPLKPESFNYKRDSLALRPARPVQARSTFGNDLVAELLEQGIITDQKNLSFHITNDELTVNGVKQSEEVRQQIISKIRNNSSGKFEFTYSSK